MQNPATAGLAYCHFRDALDGMVALRTRVA